MDGRNTPACEKDGQQGDQCVKQVGSRDRMVGGTDWYAGQAGGRDNEQQGQRV
jgi:hypothetical protein